MNCGENRGSYEYQQEIRSVCECVYCRRSDRAGPFFLLFTKCVMGIDRISLLDAVFGPKTDVSVFFFVYYSILFVYA